MTIPANSRQSLTFQDVDKQSSVFVMATSLRNAANGGGAAAEISPRLTAAIRPWTAGGGWSGIGPLPVIHKARSDPSVPLDEPVHVLIDSTGLKVYGVGQCLEEKHGARSRRGWRKLHLAVDNDSGEIIAHTMTDQDTGDASHVAGLGSGNLVH